VQRQLPGRVTLTAAYVGALSHQLPNFIDANYAPYSTAFGTTVVPSTSATSIAARRQFDPCPIAGCPTGAAAINNGNGLLGAGIVDLLSNLTASYHSLQISATKQMSAASASAVSMSGATLSIASSRMRMDFRARRIPATLALPSRQQ
jgi:hypothetical protein